jgi:hypothetical protein
MPSTTKQWLIAVSITALLSLLLGLFATAVCFACFLLSTEHGLDWHDQASALSASNMLFWALAHFLPFALVSGITTYALWRNPKSWFTGRGAV